MIVQSDLRAEVSVAVLAIGMAGALHVMLLQPGSGGEVEVAGATDVVSSRPPEVVPVSELALEVHAARIARPYERHHVACRVNSMCRRPLRRGWLHIDDEGVQSSEHDARC